MIRLVLLLRQPATEPPCVAAAYTAPARIVFQPAFTASLHLPAAAAAAAAANKRTTILGHCDDPMFSSSYDISVESGTASVVEHEQQQLGTLLCLCLCKTWDCHSSRGVAYSGPGILIRNLLGRIVSPLGSFEGMFYGDSARNGTSAGDAVTKGNTAILMSLHVSRVVLASFGGQI
jgi:hypothetical protein